MGDGGWVMVGGRWWDDGGWMMVDGRWWVDDGRWTMVGG